MAPAIDPRRASLDQCFLLGVDLGTSSAKALLVSTDGSVKGEATVDYPMFHPRPGWAEHEATDFYDAVVAVVRAVVRGADVPVSRIAGLAIVAQREPPVLLDARSEPVARTISWTDQRSAHDIAQFSALVGREHYLDTIGIVPIAGSTLASLLWLQRHSPDSLNRVQHLLFPKDYVLFRLTGDIVTDTSTPGRSGLLDIRRFCWSEDICAAAQLDTSILPDISAQPADAWGVLNARAAGELGLAAGTRLAIGGGDDPSAALGGGAIHDGDLCAGTGTASSWRIVSDERVPDRSARTDLAPHVVREVTIREAVISSTGSSMRWLRDELAPDLAAQAQETGENAYAHLIGLADDIEPGADGLYFYPYLEGSLMPRFDPRATGVFFGITAGMRRPHLVRAVVEGIAFQYPLTVDVLRSAGITIDHITLVGGEAQSSSWNQLKADVTGIEVRVPRIAGAAALGAAILAGMAAKVFATVEEAVEAMISGYQSFYPDASRHEQYVAIRQRYEEVYACLGPAYQPGPETQYKSDLREDD
jgi:xylulokinase